MNILQRRNENFVDYLTVCQNVISVTDDCAVIDEIQMIAESERGFAWTKALLGNTFKTLLYF
jgi:hypothetical protein